MKYHRSDQRSYVEFKNDKYTGKNMQWLCGGLKTWIFFLNYENQITMRQRNIFCLNLLLWSVLRIFGGQKDIIKVQQSYPLTKNYSTILNTPQYLLHTLISFSTKNLFWKYLACNCLWTTGILLKCEIFTQRMWLFICLTNNTACKTRNLHFL